MFVCLFVCFVCSGKYIYLLIVGVEEYCCTRPHSMTHTHADTPHSVGILWMRDRPVAETPPYTTHNIHKRHPCTSWDSNPQSQQPRGRRPTSWAARPPGLVRFAKSKTCKMWRGTATHRDRISSYFPEEQILVVSDTLIFLWYLHMSQYTSTEMLFCIHRLLQTASTPRRRICSGP